MIETINPPGSAEARAIMERFKQTQCQYRYIGHKGIRGEQCTDKAVWPPDNPRWCCKAHATERKGKAATFNLRSVDVSDKQE